MNRWGRRYLMGWVLLALVPACVALPGKVVDAAGAPVAHAVVALFPREGRNLAEGAPAGPGGSGPARPAIRALCIGGEDGNGNSLSQQRQYSPPRLLFFPGQAL